MHGKLLALKVYSGSNDESGGGKKKRRKNSGGGAQNSRRKANQQSRNFIERYGEKRKKFCWEERVSSYRNFCCH